jgi:cytochrome P450
MNPVWLLSQRFILPVANYLPFGLGSWTEYSSWGWGYKIKYRLRAKLGPAYTITNPGKNIVVVSDAETVDNITSRRKDFQKSEEMYKALELFGPNLDTVEGEVWQRHRRITTTPFNERNSGLVWRESQRQATDMLDSWIKKSATGVTSLMDDTMILALHVITAAAFSKPHPFAGGLQLASEGHSMTYRDALRLILANIFTAIFILQVPIPNWLAPKSFRDVKVAVKDFKKYMSEMIEEERDAIAKRSAAADNLMSVLIRASEISKAGEKNRGGLSDEELFGNLIIYNLGGMFFYAVPMKLTTRHRRS